MVADSIMGDGHFAGLHRVVAGLLVEGDKALLCHRSADRAWYLDVWDFPGGHIEDGETAPAALVRATRNWGSSFLNPTSLRSLICRNRTSIAAYG